MIFMRHAQINDGQHHKDEGLEGNYQYVEDRPGYRQGPLDPERQQRDQDKNHLPRVQVAEQPQPVSPLYCPLPLMTR